METPNGTKRTIGFALMVLPWVLAKSGYSMSEAAPVEIAAHIESWVQAIGFVVALIGEYKAKAPMWFARINRG